MAAGTAYSKRYAGGFADGSGGGTPIDSTFLNAEEAALLQLIGVAPTVDGQVAQWDFANTRFGPALLLNKNIDPAAAIAKSKLDFTGANGIVNADIAGGAAIAKSKLAALGIVDADVAVGAAIAMSKINGLGLYRKTTTKTVNTTVAATDLLNGEITVGAGVMGTTGAFRLTAWGDYLQNSGGATAAPRFQLVLGGTTLLDTSAGTAATQSSSATRGGWRLVAEVVNLGAAASQMSSLLFNCVTPGGGSAMSTAFTTGEGLYADCFNGSVFYGLNAQGVNPSTAVNTSLAQALVLNVINASASATYETKLIGALVEVI